MLKFYATFNAGMLMAHGSPCNHVAHNVICKIDQDVIFMRRTFALEFENPENFLPADYLTESN